MKFMNFLENLLISANILNLEQIKTVNNKKTPLLSGKFNHWSGKQDFSDFKEGANKLTTTP